MNREKLIAAMRANAAPKPVAVQINGYGTVYVRKLTVAEVDAQTEEASKGNKLARAAARLLCDEEGVRLFNPDSEEDVKLLASQPWEDVSEILSAANNQVIKAADPGN